MITAAATQTVHLHFVEHLNPPLCHYTQHDGGSSILHIHESTKKKKKHRVLELIFC